MSTLRKFDTEAKIDTLKFLPFNRQYKVRQDLADKMRTYGFTVPMTIIKTDVIDGKMSLWIADGQHRCVTAQYVKQIPTGVIVDTKFEDKSDVVRFVASLNSASKKWTLMDYVDSYNYLGYRDYDYVLKMYAKYPYSINTICGIFGGVRKSNAITKKVKDGTYKVMDKAHALKVLELSKSLAMYGKLTSKMLFALYHVANHKHFDETQFVANYQLKFKSVRELVLEDYTDIFTEWGGIPNL